LKTFQCHCGNILNFENTLCLACGRSLGYLSDEKLLSALEPAADGLWLAMSNGRNYRQCKNYSHYNVCNWMVAESDVHAFCLSCRLNHIIPNLNDPQNHTLWYRVEQAKRRLLYTLFGLKLPIVSWDVDPRGMGFEFLRDEVAGDVFSTELTIRQSIATGHRAGMITINLLEAEHSLRVEMREKMNENYRTLLGHFRHESGHYFWDRLISGTGNLDGFRELFGDERVDYSLALKSYYDQGPPPSWADVWISAYASVHPWEDWAETWAHYLHMVDTLETARDFDFNFHADAGSLAGDGGEGSDRIEGSGFDGMFNDWCRLSAALNALNRSMGLEDAYPFVISPLALTKLRFVHRMVIGSGG